jgi:hypothetical protein
MARLKTRNPTQSAIKCDKKKFDRVRPYQTRTYDLKSKKI